MLVRQVFVIYLLLMLHQAFPSIPGCLHYLLFIGVSFPPSAASRMGPTWGAPDPPRPPSPAAEARGRSPGWGALGRGGGCRDACAASRRLVAASPAAGRHCASCCLGKGFHDTK